MATQTCFDLNAALENWRNELNAQSQLTPDNRRELEKHLADSMAELCQRGLNEEESFWLARRRIGQPQQLAEEFVKADPTRILRERVFWVALAYLVFNGWANLLDLIHWNGCFGIPFVYIYLFAVYFPLVGLGVLLAKGMLNNIYFAATAIFKKRWLFTSCAITYTVLTQGFETLQAYLAITHNGPSHWDANYWIYFLSTRPITGLGIPLMLIALIAWLWPIQKQKFIKVEVT